MVLDPTRRADFTEYFASGTNTRLPNRKYAARRVSQCASCTDDFILPRYRDIVRLGDDPSAQFDNLRGILTCVWNIEVRQPNRSPFAQLNIARTFTYTNNIAVAVNGEVVDITAAHVNGCVIPTDYIRVETQRGIRVRRCQVEPDGVPWYLRHSRLHQHRTPRAASTSEIFAIICPTRASCLADMRPVPGAAPLPPTDVPGHCRMSNPTASRRSGVSPPRLGPTPASRLRSS